MKRPHRLVRHAFMDYKSSQLQSDQLIVICEDGTMWRWPMKSNSEWIQVDGPPLDTDESEEFCKEVNARRGALIDPKTTKLQANIKLDGDLVIWLQREAAGERMQFGDLINEILREHMNACVDGGETNEPEA